MRELDLFTSLFKTSKAVSRKLADIRHRTTELLQTTLSLTLMVINYVFLKRGGGGGEGGALDPGLGIGVPPRV